MELIQSEDCRLPAFLLEQCLSDLQMVEAYLPNIRTYIMTSIGGVREGADNAFSIMVEGVRSDVLAKIDEYMCFFFDINNTSFPVCLLVC